MANDNGAGYRPTQKAFDDPEYLLKLLGPEDAERFSRVLTDEESARVDEFLARYGNDPVAALDAGNLPEHVKSELRRVMR